MKDHSRPPGVAALVAVGAAIGLAALAGGRLRSRRRQQSTPDDAPGFAARRGFGDYRVVGRSVTIRRPRAELYALWRDFSRLAEFMENFESVEPAPDGEATVWTIRAPAGRTVRVVSRIAREEPGELIAWRSVEGSDVDTEGRVTFEDAPGERGTRVGLVVAFKPPGGAAGAGLAKLFRRDPETQARHDLKRFKMLMEAGEIATSDRRRSTEQETG